MKRIIFLPLWLIAMTFLVIHPVKAVTFIISDGPNAQQIKDMYAGSILQNNDGYNKNYWYVDPATQAKYFIKDDVTMLRLVRSLGIGINNSNLNKLPQKRIDKKVDYALVNKYRGSFLLQTQDNNTAWYLNPLDNLLYKIEGGKVGLKTLQNLAIDIDSTKLNAIAVTKNLNYNKTSVDPINFDMFWQVQNTLKSDYYQPDKVSDSDMFYGSLKGIANSLNDPYTEFFTPKANHGFQDKLAGAVEGIGAYVDIINGKFTIISPLDNSPAKTAGLLPNDQVLTVDGTDISGWLLDNTINLIKGPKGSTVKLKIYRPTTTETFEINIIRDRVTIPTVIAKKLDNNIAYFKIGLFSQDLPALFFDAKNQTIKDDTKGVIIDLRNNPGGYTNSAIDLAQYWVPINKLILRENYSNRSENFNSTKNPSINLPTVVLINQGTASASEIVTLALSKNNLAKVVGEKSFGKGTGQNLVAFEDGSALKYTVFEWFGPQDTTIQGTGITPDFIVQNTGAIDLQLQKAIDLLK